jgi:hypothetical protein
MPLLSHYTGEAGLLGIAASKALWATDFLTVNDTSEYFYAWHAIQLDAIQKTYAALPAERRRADFNSEAYVENANKKFRAGMQTRDGYGALFITSFAKSQNEDHDRRGNLTLWHKYTEHRGFCLQFNRDDVRRLVEFESWKGNYYWIELVDVQYGVDKASRDFQDLSYQLEQKMLVELLRHSGDDRIKPAWNRMWAESALMRKTLAFCARHKDPCWEDEREVRIVACPAERADARTFTGIAHRKDIHTTADGKKRFIVIGEDFEPGFVPHRIIVGAKATLPANKLSGAYPGLLQPHIADANLPVA